MYKLAVNCLVFSFADCMISLKWQLENFAKINYSATNVCLQAVENLTKI